MAFCVIGLNSSCSDNLSDPYETPTESVSAEAEHEDLVLNYIKSISSHSYVLSYTDSIVSKKNISCDSAYFEYLQEKYVYLINNFFNDKKYDAIDLPLFLMEQDRAYDAPRTRMDFGDVSIRGIWSYGITCLQEIRKSVVRCYPDAGEEDMCNRIMMAFAYEQLRMTDPYTSRFIDWLYRATNSFNSDYVSNLVPEFQARDPDRSAISARIFALSSMTKIIHLTFCPNRGSGSGSSNPNPGGGSSGNPGGGGGGGTNPNPKPPVCIIDKCNSCGKCSNSNCSICSVKCNCECIHARCPICELCIVARIASTKSIQYCQPCICVFTPQESELDCVLTAIHYVTELIGMNFTKNQIRKLFPRIDFDEGILTENISEIMNPIFNFTSQSIAAGSRDDMRDLLGENNVLITNYPVQIGDKIYGHAVVVIGYIDSGSSIIYTCLDPGTGQYTFKLSSQLEWKFNGNDSVNKFLVTVPNSN